MPLFDYLYCLKIGGFQLAKMHPLRCLRDYMCIRKRSGEEEMDRRGGGEKRQKQETMRNVRGAGDGFGKNSVP